MARDPKAPEEVPKLGPRNTRQRTAVINALWAIPNFASAKEIHQALEEDDAKVGLTTVYRTLQTLSDMDAVDVLHMPNGETLYRYCHSDEHHHHLVCTVCGRTEEIDGGPVEDWAKRIASQYGYTITGHDAEIFGTCADCDASKKESASP